MMDIPFNRPALIGNEIAYLREAIRRGQLAGDGHFTMKCNALIAELTGAKKAFLTHSCTAALEMAALLGDLGPGDEVIMPSYTFVSTANAVVLRGAKPVFVDIDAQTLNIDPLRVAEAVGPATRALFVVHYAGVAADMDALIEIARTRDILVVEDAAQALGSLYKGRPCGSLGDLAAFSFHETKNVISGEGGALTVNSSDMVERAEIIREKGTNRSQFFRGQVDKYTWVDVGSSFLPGELIASYLLAQLEMMELINTRRVSIFERYREAFSPLADAGRVRIPHIPVECTANGHMFYLIMQTLDDRTAFIEHMKQRGVISPFHYVPLHSAPAGRRFGRAQAPMTNTEHVSQTLVRLPMFFELGAQVEDVIDIAMSFFDGSARVVL